MNSIWNNNYSAFKCRFPQLAQMAGLPSPDFTPEKIWTLTQAKNGQMSASENGIRLHSLYNPQKEAENIVSQNEVKEKSASVFYGFGLGYHLMEWVKKYPQKKLVIIEPDLNHFFAAMMILDWRTVFNHKDLILALSCPPESVLTLLENSKTVNLGNSGVSDAWYFENSAFTAHAKPYFETVKSLIKRNQRKNEINAATLKKFGKLWVKNSLTNVNKMEELFGISVFKDKINGKLPFLIVGAGPSLENILPFMAELKKRTVIVCVETALRSLLRCGVEPDFIILTDPQFWAYRHIAGLKAMQSILITEISTYPAVFRFPCKKILLCSSQFMIGSYFEKKSGIDSFFGDLGTGGSVASSAWNFAYFCGSKEIYTAGLDFAFPKRQTHIKGSSAEETYHTNSYRLKTVDFFTAFSLFSANATLSKDYSGNPVLTDSRMKMFSWWFESRLANCLDAKTYTLCPQGLNTPGIIPCQVEKLLEKTEILKDKNDFLENLNMGRVDDGKIKKIKELKKSFPTPEFLVLYPFLKDYL